MGIGRALNNSPCSPVMNFSSSHRNTKSTIDFAKPIFGFPDQPLGSKRTCVNLLHNTSRGTPHCRASDTAVANESMSPEMVEPCFAMVMKISPGGPSTQTPTVKDHSCPAME